MSTTDVSVDGSSPLQDALTSPSVSRKSPGPWVWALVACVLLGVSGVLRAMQDRRHVDERSYVETCPIVLEAIPKEIGVWRLVEGGEKKLDELTRSITGATGEPLMRTYADDLTGVSLTVLVLFGSAVPVLPHTPDVCYPANGYGRVDGPSDATIKYKLGKNSEGRPIDGAARFRSSVYQKSAGRLIYREAAYHSFRLDGEWSPDIGAGRKFPRRNPGIFKIQVQRQVAEGERLGQGDPIEQFVSVLLTELEKEIRAAETKTVAVRPASVLKIGLQ